MARKLKAQSNGNGNGITLALAYSRVSDPNQEAEGVSLDIQVRECRRYALDHGWQVDHEYSDPAWSGLKVQRPEYQMLLSRVRQLRAEGHKVVVVVSSLDRFGRKLIERVRARDELDGLGVPLHSVREGGEVTGMAASMLAVMAEEESKRMSLRIKSTWKGVNGGGWFKVSPMVPWGFRSRPATDQERKAGAPQSVIEPDPAVVPYVRAVFERAAQGESMRAIAEWTRTLPVEVRGSRFSDGRLTTKPTSKEPRHTERVVGLAMVKHTLQNPTYVGRLEFYVQTENGPERREVPGRWAPIVDEQTWQRVQDTLRRHREAPRAQPDQYLLTGLVKCSRCGSGTVGHSVTRQNGTRRRRYRCVSTRYGGRCFQTLDAAQLEGLVLNEVGTLVAAIVENPAVQKALRSAWDRLSKPAADQDHDRAVRRLERQAEQARAISRGAGQKFALDLIDKPVYDDLVRDANATLRAAETELARLRNATPTAAELPSLDSVLAMAGSWATMLQRNAAAQRDVVTALVERVVPIRERRSVYRVEITWTALGKRLASIAAL
jgi:DNA invertase Pin-like site-specific DNA recombinase